MSVAEFVVLVAAVAAGLALLVSGVIPPEIGPMFVWAFNAAATVAVLLFTVRQVRRWLRE